MYRQGSRVLGTVVAMALGLGSVTLASSASAQVGDAECVTDAFESSGVVAEVCLTAPSDGSTVSGTVSVTATLGNIGTPTVPLSAFGARRLTFTLDGQTLLTDYTAPYEFLLPTTSFVDGPHTLEVSALLRDSFTDVIDHETPLAQIGLDFDNGIDVVPPNTNSFVPTSGRPASAGEPFVLAATGDGASGEPAADATADLIHSWDPNLFLYLGDVYEDGTATEFLNWYGDDETRWGRFRDVTNPTLGNHELEDGDAPGYFDYWDNVPHQYSFDAHGWHFVTVDTNTVYDQTEPGTPQYEWLREDLAAATAQCSVAFFHHPVWSIGSQGSTERLGAIWDLLVSSGVDIVLTGHDHNYQRWEPLGADGSPDPEGPTHFVAGAGGHGVRPFASSDARVVAGYDTFTAPDTRGSLRFSLDADSAAFDYVTHEGLVLDSGTIDCQEDPEPPADAFRDRIELEAATLDDLAQAGGGSTDKIEKAVEHLEKALEDELWSSDVRPADKDGHKVLEELKKAVHELDYLPQGAAGRSSIDRLVDIGLGLTQDALDEAAASFGELEELAKAQEEHDKALAKLGDSDEEGALDGLKKTFEHARKSLEKAPAPWSPGVGARGQLGDVLAGLWSEVPSGHGGDDDHLAKAVEHLTNALDPADWDDESTPSEDSDANVPEEIKKAIKELQDVSRLDMVPTIHELLAVSAGLANDAVDAAEARGGKSKEIAEAKKKIEEAEARTAAGKYHDAADSYKKAFEKAINA